MHKWFVYQTFDAASQAAADFLADRIATSVQQQGVCHVILPGGDTPVRCLGYLAEKTLPWDKVHWYPGDERCLPRGDARRNDVMLEKNFWCRLSTANVHAMPAELGAARAAEVYREVISAIECFDIAFLGMGEDGHTASLFPHNTALNDPQAVVPVYNAPKSPAERVSLSISTLRRTRCRMVLTAGEAKAAVLVRIKQGEALPVNSVGDIHWYLDAAAAAAGD
jgi:6-phosphogluconolactonase